MNTRQVFSPPLYKLNNQDQLISQLDDWMTSTICKMFFLQMGWGNSIQEQLGPRHEPGHTRYHTKWWFQPSWKIFCQIQSFHVMFLNKRWKWKIERNKQRFEITSYSHHVYIHTYLWLVWLQFFRSPKLPTKKKVPPPVNQKSSTCPPNLLLAAWCKAVLSVSSTALTSILSLALFNK